PTKKRRVKKFDRVSEYRIERDEYRQLDQHRQTTPSGIYFMSLEKRHLFLVHALGIIFEALFHCSDLRLQFLHRLHRFLRFGLQWVKDQTNEQRQQNNRNTIVVNKLVKEAKQIQERKRQKGKGSVIDQLAKTGRFRKVLVV